jgi:hypothetical protein
VAGDAGPYGAAGLAAADGLLVNRSIGEAGGEEKPPRAALTAIENGHECVAADARL